MYSTHIIAQRAESCKHVQNAQIHASRTVQCSKFHASMLT
nr:MAG TPA: hypothetical protein [Bacteriophage sp.]